MVETLLTSYVPLRIRLRGSKVLFCFLCFARSEILTMDNGKYEEMTRDQLYLWYRKWGVQELEARTERKQVSEVLKRKFPPKAKVSGEKAKKSTVLPK